MLRFLGCALVAWAALAPATGLAAPTTREVIEQLEGDDVDAKDFVQIYLTAAQDAYSWVNVLQVSAGAEPYYCIPSNIALTVDQLSDIVIQYAATNVESQDYDVNLSLLLALREKFPCE